MSAFPSRRARPDAPFDPVAPEDLARLLPAPGGPDLPRDRHLLLKEHLLSEIQLAGTDSTPAVAPAPRRPRRRFLVAAGSLTAAALVATFALGGHPAASGGSADAASHQQAVSLLGQIADAAYAKPAVTVRGDQFAYIDSQVAFLSNGVLSKARDRKIWLSVDGSQAGLLEDPQNAVSMPNQGLGTNPNPSLGSPTYAYLAKLPTDPAALLKVVDAAAQGTGDGQDAEAFTIIGDLLRESITPPALSAALYRAAALIPGVVEVPDSVDALGRHGVAVARVDTVTGTRTEWIFDKTTLSYLGERDVQVTDTGAAKPGTQGLEIKAGTVVGETAVITRAIVDKAGETD